MLGGKKGLMTELYTSSKFLPVSNQRILTAVGRAGADGISSCLPDLNLSPLLTLSWGLPVGTALL